MKPSGTGHIPLALDGYTQLPPGMLGNAVTWLEMRAPFPQPPELARNDLSVQPLRGRDMPRYRDIFEILGERWLWDARLRMDHAVLAHVLDDPGVAAFALLQEGRDAGLLELDFREAGSAELAYFGVFDALIGTGAGQWLMRLALALATARNVRRLWVHTCNFDHPGALGFYRRSGFTPYRCGFEVMRDPRLDGLLPRHAAPHVPLLGGIQEPISPGRQ